jgi:hypothetical protein
MKRAMPVGPQQPHIKMIYRVNEDMKPDAKDARDEHFEKACLIGQAEGLHYRLEEIAQGIRGQAPRRTERCTNQECVGVPVYGKGTENQHLNINNNVGQQKDRQVYPPSQHEP